MNIHRTPFLRIGSAIVFVFALTSLLASCKQANTATDPGTNQPGTPIVTSIPKSPGAIVDPADNPSSPAKIELGRHLLQPGQGRVDLPDVQRPGAAGA